MIVMVVTALTMIVEIAAGIAYGSMALLADGLHMASHAVALGITLLAYIYARRNALDRRFSFGTGKVNSLAGFSSAVILAMFALIMAWESVVRLVNPVDICFNQALVVAVLGLIVNGASVLILGQSDGHDHHGHEHEHHGHHDHNLRAAYLHVMADALTSVLAIFALLAGKYLGSSWMDPAMGIVGACLVGRWSIGLLVTTSRVLLDHQGPDPLLDAIRRSIEQNDDNHVSELHAWTIGPGIYAAIITVVSDEVKPPQHYKDMIPTELGVVHKTIEVHRREE
jgi:cation diffusion facilitator family transporter